MVTSPGPPLALAAVLRARDGTLLEGFVVVRRGGKLETELQTASFLKVARPDLFGFVRANAGYQEDEGEVFWPLTHESGREVVGSIVKKVGMQELLPLGSKAACYSDVYIILRGGRIPACTRHCPLKPAFGIS